MQKIIVCLIGMVAFICLANAQQLDLSKKQTKAFRTEKAPKIDGELTEMLQVESQPIEQRLKSCTITLPFTWVR